MSSAVFEVLHAVSKTLEDDFIDEDQTEIEVLPRGQRYENITNRSITVRGLHQGRAVILQYADYWSESFGAVLPNVYERDVLEIFVAQQRVTLEGLCRRRTVLDKLGRWVGRGGVKGRHRVFETTRIDATEGTTACLEQPLFAESLERIATHESTRRVKLQSGTGVGVVLTWRRFSFGDVMGWLERVNALAATLDF